MLCIGQCKDKTIDTLSKDYLKRINTFLPFNLVELKDKKGKRASSEEPFVVDQMLKHIQSRDFLVLLDSEGEMMSSTVFSKWVSDYFLHNRNPLVFVIGGASGIPSVLYQRCQLKLSFSRMTFPHELFRLMFLEQMYRSFTIIHHFPYHK